MVNFGCPKCNNPISKKWLFKLSFQKIYRCPKCGSNLSWNIYSSISSFVGNLIGTGICIYTKDSWSIDNIYCEILIVITILVITQFLSSLLLPNLIFPNSISIVEKEK